MDRKDAYKMLGLILTIALIIILGLYLVNPTGYTILKCAEFSEPYSIFEPYKEQDYEIRWGEVYLKVLEKVNIPIPSNRPTFISYELCKPCKYNVTFLSTSPTNFFVFDEYNKEKYFERKSAFPVVSEKSSENKTFSFEIGEKGKYYFVLDRSSQGKTRNDPATGKLIIYELKGFNMTIWETKYKEITNYRNVTRCN